MALKIKHSSLMESKVIVVKPAHFVVTDSSNLLTGKTIHDYREVDAVLMGDDFVLSVQFGDEVFAIQTRPDKPRHQEVIEALLANVKAAQGVG